MKRQILLSLSIGALLVACAPQNNQAAPAALQSAEAGVTRIDTDQGTGAIRFIVDGQEQAVIDGSGLHVRKKVDANNLVLRGDESLPGDK